MTSHDSARQSVVLDQKYLVGGESELKRIEPLLRKYLESYTKLSTLLCKFHFLDVFTLLSLEPVHVCVFFLEYFSFPYGHFIENDLQSLGVDNSALVYITISNGVSLCRKTEFKTYSVTAESSCIHQTDVRARSHGCASLGD